MRALPPFLLVRLRRQLTGAPAPDLKTARRSQDLRIYVAGRKDNSVFKKEINCFN